jgi:exopolysaccharide/PEP-CTERM locus tyrosine autokinase
MEICELGHKKPVYTKTRVIPTERRHLEEHRIVTLLNNPEATDCYNLLRIQVLERTRREGQNAIMVTSPLDGEGKTVTAINLAASIAREAEQTALLVDVNLRRPKVHEYLGCAIDAGLCDYLLDDVPLKELLFNPEIDRLVVLPAGTPSAESTRILGSPKMENLIQEMRSRYCDRYIIFDCPALLTSPDAIAFSSHVDSVILVVEAGKTPKGEIVRALELLKGRYIIGFFVNRLKTGSRNGSTRRS